MRVAFTDYQIDELTRMFDDAMDNAIAGKVDTRQEFTLIAFSYVIGALTEYGALNPVIWAKYHQLGDRFCQIPLGKEVNNCARRD